MLPLLINKKNPFHVSWLTCGNMYVVLNIPHEKKKEKHERDKKKLNQIKMISLSHSLDATGIRFLCCFFHPLRLITQSSKTLSTFFDINKKGTRRLYWVQTVNLCEVHFWSLLLPPPYKNKPQKLFFKIFLINDNCHQPLKINLFTRGDSHKDTPRSS